MKLKNKFSLGVVFIFLIGCQNLKKTCEIYHKIPLVGKIYKKVDLYPSIINNNGNLLGFISNHIHTSTFSIEDFSSSINIEMILTKRGKIHSLNILSKEEYTYTKMDKYVLEIFAL